MAINLAVGQFQKKVADKFYQESVIGGHTNKEYSWDGSKSITIPTIVTVAPGDYTRSGTSRYGTPTDVQDTIQTLPINQDKSVSLVVDKGNNKQQMMIKNAGKVLALEIREQFVPMVDKYALSTWADYIIDSNKGNHASTNKTVHASLDKDTIVEAITGHVQKLGNSSASLNDAIVYVGWSKFAMLLNAPEFLNLEKLGTKALADGAIGKVNGLAIKPVPDDYLPENTNFMTVKKASVMLPFQIKETKIHEDAPGISGALMEVRYLYDAFVLEAKYQGVLLDMTA